MKQYQTLLEMAIKEAHKDPISREGLVTEVFETVMKIERQMFLDSAQNGENKGSGCYQRFIPSFQGAMQIRVPRDRIGSFSPLLLEIAKMNSEKCSELALLLYSKGLSTRTVEEVITQLFGERMSPSKVSEIAQKLQPIREAWQARPLTERYFSIQIDALRVHVRREDVYNEACFIVLGTLPDGKREILGLYLFPEEGAHAWMVVFQDLLDRGLKFLQLIISDELTGITSAVKEYYPAARHQLCLIHRKRNLVNHIRADKKADFSYEFNEVFALDDPQNSLEAISTRLQKFTAKWSSAIPRIADALDPDKLEYYAAYLHFPYGIRKMIYTTNWIERLNKQIRKVIKRVPAFPTTDSLLNLVFAAVQQFENGPYKRHIPAFYQYIRPYYQNNDQPNFTTPDTI